jgi:hypothetical protein
VFVLPAGEAATAAESPGVIFRAADSVAARTSDESMVLPVGVSLLPLEALVEIYFKPLFVLSTALLVTLSAALATLDFQSDMFRGYVATLQKTEEGEGYHRVAVRRGLST